jgi:hypothetical protein
MSYLEIDDNIIKVGDPITKELLDLIKTNFADHETRIAANETTGGSVFILDSAIHLANFNPDSPDVFYYKAIQDFDVAEFRAQLFNKGSIAAGTLALDLQKSVDTNDSNFNSILSGSLQFDFSTDASYSEKVATIDTSVNSINAGEVLRIVVVGMPPGFKDKILVNIEGE